MNWINPYHRAFDNWIYDQLNPNNIVTTGKPKSHVPAFIEKNRAIDALIGRIGLQAYKDRVAEDMERELRNFEY